MAHAPIADYAASYRRVDEEAMRLAVGAFFDPVGYRLRIGRAGTCVPTAPGASNWWKTRRRGLPAWPP